MTRIKAAICHRFGEPLSVEEIDIADPGPGEVMVDVKACAICHSDIFYAEGAWGGGLYLEKTVSSKRICCACKKIPT